MDYTWYEVSMKDWDKLTEGAREIFIDDTGKITFAVRGDLLKHSKVTTGRKINN